MTDKTINYESLTQDAMRGMVQNLLVQIAQTGLPGEHHFYITFKTRAPNVQIADNLLASHPQEMTIVLQHQYKDLVADSEGFAVTLSFNQTPHKLYIPYAAMISFYDPSAEFGLRFSLDDEPEDDAGADDYTAVAVAEAATEEHLNSGDNIVSIDQFRDK
jgi:hypothetical protein